ncbi:MAG: hypothetical protein HC796_11205 [Synechococcaceae cyanobacterium RL_1_2]|nr:hypothetical protein [Synechococcaceae cyanobacterium RL_1_2]
METIVDSTEETVQALTYQDYLSPGGDLSYEWVTTTNEIRRKQVVFSEPSSQTLESMLPTLTELLDNQYSSLAEEKLAAVTRRETDLLTFDAKGKNIQIGLNGQNRIFISVQ